MLDINIAQGEKMHYGNEELLDLLIECFPKGFFQQLLEFLKESHQRSCSDIEKLFSQQVAKDLIPHYCRAIFEDKMKELAENHNLSYRSALNRKKNAYHTEIEAEIDSKKIIMTALAVNNCCFDLKRVQAAQFRQSLAENPWLFEEFKSHGDAYYGLIMHGANSENSGNLNFAYLAFPTADCEGWYGQYNLFDLAGESVEMEVIEDMADPKLRPDVIHNQEAK